MGKGLLRMEREMLRFFFGLGSGKCDHPVRSMYLDLLIVQEVLSFILDLNLLLHVSLIF